MGGIFGVVSKEDCVEDLFYGTDYHSHLGTRRGGLAVRDAAGLTRFIHDITSAQFRSKFAEDLPKLRGSSGIGVISDYEDQPLIIGSHLGIYALVTVGVVQNIGALSQRLYTHGAREVHMRPACPPLVFGCKFLNFSRSKSELDLAGRRAIGELEGPGGGNVAEYADPDSPQHAAMVERIRIRLGLSSLKYQRLEDLVAAIDLPKDQLCTYCWDACG